MICLHSFEKLHLRIHFNSIFNIVEVISMNGRARSHICSRKKNDLHTIENRFIDSGHWKRKKNRNFLEKSVNKSTRYILSSRLKCVIQNEIGVLEQRWRCFNISKLLLYFSAWLPQWSTSLCDLSAWASFSRFCSFSNRFRTRRISNALER